MSVEILNSEKIMDGQKMRVKLRVSADEKAEIVQESLEALAEMARLPKDEKLRSELEKQVGADRLASAISLSVAQNCATKPVNDLKLHILFDPELVGESIPGVFAEGPAEFSVDMVLCPEMELSSYEPVHIKVNSLEVTDAMVDAQVAQVLEMASTYEPTDEPVAEGRVIQVEMETQVNGKPATGLSGKNMPLNLDPTMVPKELIERATGMVKGEEREFEFSMLNPQTPAARPDLFHVKLKVLDIREKKTPELTDELVATTISPLDGTVEKFREHVREDMKAELDRRNEQQTAQQLDSELAKRLQGSISDMLLQRAGQDAMANMQQSLAQQGMNMQQYMQQMGMEQQQFQMMMMVQARESLRQGFALDALARHLKLELTDEDIEAALHQMSPGNEQAMRANFDKNDAWFLVNDIAMRMKAHNWLAENSTID
ncbi:trigger factor [Slackia heliotrinireducens]|uniref:trigger factor n=1 Tax=Slackia heliotrinireducens TaxID=84110 RepID=UPI003315F42C